MALILMGLWLSACGPAAQAPPLPSNQEAGDSRPELPNPDIEASLGEMSTAPDFPAEATPQYVGRWASNAGACKARAWQFTADGLQTPAGSVCRFEQVEKVAKGYDVEARCTADGPEQPDRIRMRLEGSDRMAFSADVLADAKLTSCGPSEAP